MCSFPTLPFLLSLWSVTSIIRHFKKKKKDKISYSKQLLYFVEAPNLTKWEIRYLIYSKFNL